MEPTILVTAYQNPDLDGTACAIAYAEFLTKTGINAKAALFGKPHQEAQFVFKTFGIKAPPNADKGFTKETPLILVDASDLRGISDKVDPNQVIEMIDHRQVHEADQFPKAQVQIELVGSCATLIAEKFAETNTSLSTSSAALLYSAIISNTVNFKANVTTSRDSRTAAWLLHHFEIPQDYIRTMFLAKSKLKQPLKEIVEGDFATFEFGWKKLGIAQLEIAEVSAFLANKSKELKTVLTQLKSERKLDFVFATVIDILESFNTFVVTDQPTQQLLQQTLHVTFDENGLAKQPGIKMRKTIVPLIKEKLEA